MAEAFICLTCGTQFAESVEPPVACPICSDERQYTPREGQLWTTLAALRLHHQNRIAEEAGVLGIGTHPKFAIGQRALLIVSRAGNVLWDCVSSIDEPTIDAVRKHGGLSAIAVSHPHYYGAMVEWSRAFGNAPIYLHAADREWVMRPDPAIIFWEGAQRRLSPTLSLIHCGGHFAGGTVLHQSSVADGPGALYCGDIITVIPDRRYVSFMRSYPNYIPLSARAVRRIGAAVGELAFDRIYGAFWGDVIFTDAHAAVERSVARYVHAVSE
jgi:DNA-directed RNA polymerase subunit RPC12/RpoP